MFENVSHINNECWNVDYSMVMASNLLCTQFESRIKYDHLFNLFNFANNGTDCSDVLYSGTILLQQLIFFI